MSWKPKYLHARDKKTYIIFVLVVRIHNHTYLWIRYFFTHTHIKHFTIPKYTIQTMKTLPILQQTTPPPLPKPTQWPSTAAPLHSAHRLPLCSPRTWRLVRHAKGFAASSPKGKKYATPKEDKKMKKDDNISDDKIPDVVWGRMIQRILVFVGVPLGIGFAILVTLDALKGQGVWSAPKWVPFLTTFVTFGSSALGIAYGSLSTSLDAEKEGSFVGFEQVEKNWEEMWREEEDADDEKSDDL